MLVRMTYPPTLDSLLGDLFETDTAVVTTCFPPIDVAEYENESVIVAELPGVKKEDLKLTIEKSWLTISGERKPFEVPQDAKVLLNEMQVREFNRTIRFPHAVDVDNITAELRNGMLRVVLPKSPEARIRTVEIK